VTLWTLERPETNVLNAFGLVGFTHDLEAFQHLAETLAETTLSRSERDATSSRGVGVDEPETLRGGTNETPLRLRLQASLATPRALLSLFEERDDSTEAFVEDALARFSECLPEMDPDSDSRRTASLRFVARAVRVVDKYRDAPHKNETETRPGNVSFASTKRLDAVAEALRAKEKSFEAEERFRVEGLGFRGSAKRRALSEEYFS
jgi:hypothetical protein